VNLEWTLAEHVKCLRERIFNCRRDMLWAKKHHCDEFFAAKRRELAGLKKQLAAVAARNVGLPTPTQEDRPCPPKPD
jgi:hypothetical protein